MTMREVTHMVGAGAALHPMQRVSGVSVERNAHPLLMAGK